MPVDLPTPPVAKPTEGFGALILLIVFVFFLIGFMLKLGINVADLFF